MNSRIETTTLELWIHLEIPNRWFDRHLPVIIQPPFSALVTADKGRTGTLSKISQVCSSTTETKSERYRFAKKAISVARNTKVWINGRLLK